MKLNTHIKSAFLIIILFLSTSANIEVKPIAKEGACEQIVKYYVSKINAGGQEMNVKFMATFNPKLKTVTAEFEGQEKKVSKMTIKACSLNAELTTGYAIYEVNKDEDAIDLVKIEAKDGKIHISNPEPKNENEKVNMTVDKWEVLKP